MARKLNWEENEKKIKKLLPCKKTELEKQSSNVEHGKWRVSMAGEKEKEDKRNEPLSFS